MEQTRPALNPKIRPIFRSNTLWRGTLPENLTKSRKCKPKMLSSLVITNVRSENIGTKGFRDLVRAITDAKRVVSLLFEDTTLSPRQVAHILHLTTHSKSCRFVDDPTQGAPSKKTARSLLHLSKNKNVTDLPMPLISTPDINKGIACRLYKQLQGLNKLGTLSLEIPIGNILPEGLPRSLVHLSILLKQRVDHQLLEKFASIIHRHCHQLNHLSLSFDEKYDVQPSDAEIWLPAIQKMKALQELRFIKDFAEFNQTFEGVLAFFKGLRNLTHITTLELGITHNYVYLPPPSLHDSFFNSLFTNLEPLNQLKKLKLDLPYCLKMQSTHFQQFSSALQNLNSLHHLACHFAPIESPNEAVLPLFQTIQNLHSLRVLDLTFFQADLTRSTLKTLLNQIPGDNLDFFKLNLGRPLQPAPRKISILRFPVIPVPTITIQGLSPGEFALEKVTNLWKGKLNSIFSGLSNFSALSSLDLQLSNCHISTQDFTRLAHLLTGMEELSSLAIEFPELDSTKNFEGLQSLVSCFRELINLRELKIVFAGEQVCDQEIDVLASNLIGCQKLESIKLRIRHGGLLTSWSLESLLAGLNDLEALRFLHLLFEYREAFQEEALFEFLKRLTVLKNLEDLKFVDLWTQAAGQVMIVGLPESLKGYRNLRNLRKFLVNDSRYI